MKYIKKYENISKDPQVYDYVLCEEYNTVDAKKVNNLIKNKIGIITEIITNIKYYTDNPYVVKFNFTDIELSKQFPIYLFDDNSRSFNKEEIIICSPNIEDIKLYLYQKKYNL